MTYVIAYDISNRKLRSKVARALEAQCNRVQKSVFEFDGDINELEKIVAKLRPLIPDTDSLRVWKHRPSKSFKMHPSLCPPNTICLIFDDQLFLIQESVMETAENSVSVKVIE